MSIKRTKFCFLIMLLFWQAFALGQSKILYVAPNGNDNWSGSIARRNSSSTDGPLASLNGARDAIRRLRLSGALLRGVKVEVENGVYSLEETLTFTPEDGGTETSPIVYEAQAGAKPVFIGGRTISGFSRGMDGIWSATIPEVKQGKWYFEQLFVNSRRATRARTPNKNYYYMLRKADRNVLPLQFQVDAQSKRTFVACSSDVRPLFALSKEELKDVVLVAYHSWEVSLDRIAAIDSNTSTVLTANPAPWDFMGMGQNQRYHLENFELALDEPGEWFLERNGTLLYMPLPNEDMAKAEVIAPTVDQFVVFQGKGGQGGKVENIILKGLSFTYSRYSLPSEGYEGTQAASSIGAVIVLDSVRKISIVDCEIEHTGIWGIWFRRGCEDSDIRHCYLHDLGAGGIRIGETNFPKDSAGISRAITIDNNILSSGGRVFRGATGMLVGQSPYNVITHNDISDFFYSGISVGWQWGYGVSFAHHNRLEFNHIHHLGWGVLSDMGGIYTLGVSPGTRIANNVVHDVYSYDLYGRGGWGIYNDEGSSYITIENNLVYNVRTGGYFQNYGQENLVRNNIFAFSLDGQLQRGRVENHLSFTFQNNIVYWSGGRLLTGQWKGTNVSLFRNLYYDATGQPVLFNDLTLTDWQRLGKDTASLIADPKFIDANNQDFHLRSDSPALNIGFKPFDYSRAGVYGDVSWIARAKENKFSPIEPVPEPPPICINDDFEPTAIGGKPANAQVVTEGHGDTIAVTNETAASGQHSLKIVDAPGLKFPYNPQFYYNLYNATGTAHLSFDLLVENGVNINHSWRDWRESSFRLGPSFMIQNNELLVDKRKLIDIPNGKWVHIDVIVGLGKQSTNSWELVITIPQQKAQRFSGLKMADPKFEVLTWLGFISEATERTVYYLDNLRLTDERIQNINCEPLIDR